MWKSSKQLWDTNATQVLASVLHFLTCSKRKNQESEAQELHPYEGAYRSPPRTAWLQTAAAWNKNMKCSTSLSPGKPQVNHKPKLHKMTPSLYSEAPQMWWYKCVVVLLVHTTRVVAVLLPQGQNFLRFAAHLMPLRYLRLCVHSCQGNRAICLRAKQKTTWSCEKRTEQNPSKPESQWIMASHCMPHLHANGEDHPKWNTSSKASNGEQQDSLSQLLGQRSWEAWRNLEDAAAKQLWRYGCGGAACDDDDDGNGHES